MTNAEAIKYLGYLRENYTREGSLMCQAVDTAIEALKPKVIHTNADRIRQMTDEELASFIDIYNIEDICKTRCAVVNYNDCMAGEQCKANILAWLKQDASEAKE